MGPSVDSAVNEGAFSPINGMRRFLNAVRPGCSAELPLLENKSLSMNICLTLKFVPESKNGNPVDILLF